MEPYCVTWFPSLINLGARLTLEQWMIIQYRVTLVDRARVAWVLRLPRSFVLDCAWGRDGGFPRLSSHNGLVPTGMDGQVCSIVCMLEVLFPSGYMANLGNTFCLHVAELGSVVGVHTTSMLCGFPMCYRSIYTRFSLYCCQLCADILEVNELPEFRLTRKSCCISIQNVRLYFVTFFQCISTTNH